jgi:hypothetical protein
MCNCNINEICYKIRYIITNSWVLLRSPKHLYKYRFIVIKFGILLKIPKYYLKLFGIITNPVILLQIPVYYFEVQNTVRKSGGITNTGLLL